MFAEISIISSGRDWRFRYLASCEHVGAIIEIACAGAVADFFYFKFSEFLKSVRARE